MAEDQVPDLPIDPSEEDISLPEGEPGAVRLDVQRKYQRQAAFLLALAETGVVREACRRAGISTRLVYGFWLKREPVFAASYREALRDAADVVEEELRRRAIDGVDEVVVHMGMPTFLEDPVTREQRPFTVKKYSDGCLLALIKARKPEQFRENHRVEHSVKDGTGVLVVPAAIDPAAWEKAATEQQARFRGEAAGAPEGGAPPPARSRD